MALVQTKWDNTRMMAHYTPVCSQLAPKTQLTVSAAVGELYEVGEALSSWASEMAILDCGR